MITNLTAADYERVAREFLGFDYLVEIGWFSRHDETRTPGQTSYEAHGAPDPGPSWSFFGACWEECVKRGWWVCPEHSEHVGQRVTISWGDGYDDDAQVEGDPRVALPACIIQWLDAQGDTHD